MKIYALSVCFASLICCAITTGFFLFNIVKIVAPEATIDPNTMRYYTSSEAFRNSPFYSVRANPRPFAMGMGPVDVILPPAQLRSSPTDTPELSEGEIDKLRLQRRDAVISGHTFRARQGIILQTIIMLISLVLFAGHWKLAKKLTHESSI